jgi:diguanylate cyclase (GGDEF)-like protein
MLGGHLQVRRVRTRQALIEAVLTEAPDLVLLAIEQLGGEGWAALQTLTDTPEADLPVLVVSTDVDGGGVARAFTLGASEHVHRGAPIGELLARVDQVLRRSRQRRMLKALAQTDGLTGLANFRAFSLRLEEEFKRSQRYHHPMAVVMLDLDHLKELNDRHGHEAGNRALLAFVRHLRTNLREVDFAARYGGDEFVVILPHQSAAEAAIFAERVRAGLSAVHVPLRDDSDLEAKLTISIGVADHTPAQPCVSAPDLLDAADAALYRAKSAGRNRLVVWSPERPVTLPAARVEH